MIRWGVSKMRRAGIHYFYFGDPSLLQTSHYLTFFALNLPYDYHNPIYLNAKLEEREIERIKNIFNKRITTRLPTPYITKECWYGSSVPQTKFYINKDAIIPRSPIHRKLKDFMKDITWKNNRVLDLCTGSGVLGIILALSNSDIQVDLADICPKALKVAQINVDKHNLRKRVKCIQSDLFKNIKNKYDFIITNPPYVSAKEYKTIYVAEASHEPALSLRSGKDGFKHIKQIIEEVPDYLNSEGTLAAEIGPHLSNLVKFRYSHLKFEWFKGLLGFESVFLWKRRT